MVKIFDAVVGSYSFINTFCVSHESLLSTWPDFDQVRSLRVSKTEVVDDNALIKYDERAMPGRTAQQIIVG